MERGEWDDEPEYPRAPLPAHERVWRHPSEQGATAWTQSEPPLVVGKGLSVATGTVGAVLALGLLWLMIPHNNRGSGGVAEVTSTVRTVGTTQDSGPRQSGLPLSIVSTSVAATNPTGGSNGSGDTTPRTFVSSTAPRSGGTSGTLVDQSTSGTDTIVITSDSSEISPPVPPSTAAGSAPPSSSGTGPTTASSSVGSTTISVTPTTSGAVLPGGTTSTPPTATPSSSSATTSAPSTTTPGRGGSGVAYAVALAPGHFVAATAAAVGGQSSLNVQLPSGDTVVGSVVSVDTGSGIAILSIPSDTQTTPIQTSTSAGSGGATVMGPQPTPASIYRDAVGTQITYDPAAQVAEGSLVLDSSQRLIGMCTVGQDGVHVLEAKDLLQAINGAMANEGPVWLGLNVAGPNDLTVAKVSPDGPASVATIQLGDVIQGVDGTAVADIDTMRSLVQAHHPGETVTLSILKVGATTPVDVPVVLTANPGSL